MGRWGVGRVCGLLLLATLYGAVPPGASFARSGPASLGHPDWSPDGAWIAFEADWAGQPDVYRARADGSEVLRLTRAPGMDSYPRVSPDGSRIAYLTRDQAFTVAVVGVDGGEPRGLAGAGNLEPAFSPDGRRLAVRSYLGGADADGEIAVVELAGGDPLVLTDNGVEDGYPSFSPDGRLLYFHRAVGGVRQVMRLDLETGEEVQLTWAEADSWHAHASPDGRALVFDSERDGQRELYRMELADRSVQRLTHHPARDGYPKWSPDGRRIAFHSDRGGTRGIWILDLDDRSVTPFRPGPP